eukprot:TRINITY_DN9215_c0_g1_i1.p1 TRINITY_DN9215_c0_g1~~TRINITY_DN9215_c0_g1_i1.p1  ORF type:complete len:735 (-),score=189.41 TRINITY_DN9215_c0_g1_i1:45-2249(-)
MKNQKAERPNLNVPYALVLLKQQMLKMDCETTEGLFRIPGNAMDIGQMRKQFDQNNYEINTDDINTVAAMFKLWLRELPEPVFPIAIYNQCITTNKKEPVLELVNSLPENHRNTLRFVVKFLQHLSANEIVAHTKMNAENLAMVFAPCLLRSPSNDPTAFLENSTREKLFVLAVIEYLVVTDDQLNLDVTGPPAPEPEAALSASNTPVTSPLPRSSSHSNPGGLLRRFVESASNKALNILPASPSVGNVPSPRNSPRAVVSPNFAKGAEEEEAASGSVKLHAGRGSSPNLNPSGKDSRRSKTVNEHEASHHQILPDSVRRAKEKDSTPDSPKRERKHKRASSSSTSSTSERGDKHLGLRIRVLMELISYQVTYAISSEPERTTELMNNISSHLKAKLLTVHQYIFTECQTPPSEYGILLTTMKGMIPPVRVIPTPTDASEEDIALYVEVNDTLEQFHQHLQFLLGRTEQNRPKAEMKSLKRFLRSIEAQFIRETSKEKSFKSKQSTELHQSAGLTTSLGAMPALLEDGSPLLTADIPLPVVIPHSNVLDNTNNHLNAFLNINDPLPLPPPLPDIDTLPPPPPPALDPPPLPPTKPLGPPAVTFKNGDLLQLVEIRIKSKKQILDEGEGDDVELTEEMIQQLGSIRVEVLKNSISCQNALEELVVGKCDIEPPPQKQPPERGEDELDFVRQMSLHILTRISILSWFVIGRIQKGGDPDLVAEIRNNFDLAMDMLL